MGGPVGEQRRHGRPRAARRCARGAGGPGRSPAPRPAAPHAAPPPLPRRAVLSLDDDILLPCSDVEAAFALWRASPRQLVGWYPRLLLPAGGERGAGPPLYRFEPAVFQQVGARVCGGGRPGCTARGSRCALHAGTLWAAPRQASARQRAREPASPSGAQLRAATDMPSNAAPPSASRSARAPAAGPVQRDPGGRGLHGQRHALPRLLVGAAGARPRARGRGAPAGAVFRGGDVAAHAPGCCAGCPLAAGAACRWRCMHAAPRGLVHTDALQTLPLSARLPGVSPSLPPRSSTATTC